MTQDKLFTVEEVAERLGVGIETVRRWIRSKELQAMDLGGRAGYRITEAALQQFLRERLNTSQSD